MGEQQKSCSHQQANRDQDAHTGEKPRHRENVPLGTPVWTGCRFWGWRLLGVETAAWRETRSGDKAVRVTSSEGHDAEPPAWTVASSKVVFSHPFVKLAEDTVVLPSGGTESWIRFADERDGEVSHRAAGALCQRDDGRFLVSRQWCLGPQRVVHELPGGGVAPGETLEQGLRRELQEEVGLLPRRLEHLGAVLWDNRKSSMRIHIYLASDLEESSLSADASEVIAWEWLSEDEIDRAIASELFEHAFLLAAWAMFKARQRYPTNP